MYVVSVCFFFFFQAEDGIRDYKVTGVQTCALPIWEIAVLSVLSLFGLAGYTWTQESKWKLLAYPLWRPVLIERNTLVNLLGIKPVIGQGGPQLGRCEPMVGVTKFFSVKPTIG